MTCPATEKSSTQRCLCVVVSIMPVKAGSDGAIARSINTNESSVESGANGNTKTATVGLQFDTTVASQRKAILPTQPMRKIATSCGHRLQSNRIPPDRKCQKVRTASPSSRARAR
jgi:hypothetical protein